jgi:hypothetical protein
MKSKSKVEKYYVDTGLNDWLQDCFCVVKSKTHKQVGPSYLRRSSARRKIRQLLRTEKQS